MTLHDSGRFAVDTQDCRGQYAIRTQSDGTEIAPLEKIPHLMRKVSEKWGSRELSAFIDSLFLDTRDGKREGFSPGVTDDLTCLAETNVIARAILMVRKHNISYREALRKVEEEDQEQTPVTPFGDPSTSRDLAYRDRGENRHIQSSLPDKTSDRRSGIERQRSDGGGLNLLAVLRVAAYFVAIALVGKLILSFL